MTVMALSNIGGMRRSVLSLTDAHLARRQHIEALRSQIYVSSVLVRDYLLDSKPGVDTSYRDRLKDNHAAALQQLEALSRVSSPTTSITVKSLAAELQAYWASVEALLQDTAENPAVSAYEHLRNRIIPRRQAVIALAEEFADAGTAEARASRQAVDASIDSLWRNTLLSTLITLLLTAALTVFTTIRVLHLERAAATEHARVERAEEEMRQLSQKLVASQEQERRSLSRELHDHVGQMVTSLRFGLTDLERESNAPSPEFTETLRRCRSMLEETIDAIRGIAMGLRPSMLDDLGLTAAIEWQAREFSKRFNLPVTVNVDPRLANWPEPQRTVLYRITQEALTNCARHAQARSVRIDLAQSEDFISLAIVDDGIGITPGASVRGFGLLGMEERVREIGGRLSLHSRASAGTMVQVRLPMAGVAVDV
jgi:signal transduction histidine kinase